MRKLFLVIAFFISLNAAPSKAFKFLMNDPTTMLDFGIYKLEQSLDNNVSQLKVKYNIFHTVNYDWDNDQLEVIRTLTLINNKKNISTALCKKELKNFKQNFYYYDGKTKIYYYLHNFRHNGFQKGKNEDQQLIENIPSRTVSKIILYTNGFKKNVSCKSVLTSDEILIIQ